MARITVEDCLKKTDSQYDLVLLAKERTSQLNAGESPLVSIDNDKNTVLALREIAEGKISIKSLEDSGIDKLRKHKEETTELDDIDDIPVVIRLEGTNSEEAHKIVRESGLGESLQMADGIQQAAQKAVSAAN